MVFQLQPQLKIFITHNIYSTTKSQTDQTITPPSRKKIQHTSVAIMLPHDELVMKSYIHVQMAIVGTHHHNLHANKDYWLITSNVGIKIQKALNCSTGLFSHILGTSNLQNGTK